LVRPEYDLGLIKRSYSRIGVQIAPIGRYSKWLTIPVLQAHARTKVELISDLDRASKRVKRINSNQDLSEGSEENKLNGERFMVACDLLDPAIANNDEHYTDLISTIVNAMHSIKPGKGFDKNKLTNYLVVLNEARPGSSQQIVVIELDPYDQSFNFDKLRQSDIELVMDIPNTFTPKPTRTQENTPE
jgi:hypothetical protein